MKKFLNFSNVLCLSPHPDDVEYSMLGSMIKFQDTNFTILNLSKGGRFDKTTSEMRMKECKLIWDSLLNVSGQLLHDEYLINQEQDELIFKIENILNIGDFDALFIPADNDTHQDHNKVTNVGRALTRKDMCSIVEYKTPHTLNNWIPNLFISLDDENIWNLKIELLDNFTTQLNQPYFKPNPLKNFHIDFLSSRKKINLVESYKIITNYC